MAADSVHALGEQFAQGMQVEARPLVEVGVVGDRFISLWLELVPGGRMAWYVCEDYFPGDGTPWREHAAARFDRARANLLAYTSEPLWSVGFVPDLDRHGTVIARVAGDSVRVTDNSKTYTFDLPRARYARALEEAARRLRGQN